MTTAKLRAAFIAGALCFAASTAFAAPQAAPVAQPGPASPATRALLNNVVPNVDFLDRSSRFALTNSKAAGLRAFALGEAREQTLAANAIDAYTDSAKEALMTGRSAATSPGDMRLPLGQEDLDSLEGLTGTAFDAQFKDRQLDALRQVADSYAAYIAKGDDPALLAIASRELPKVKHRLEMLGRI